MARVTKSLFSVEKGSEVTLAYWTAVKVAVTGGRGHQDQKDQDKSCKEQKRGMLLEEKRKEKKRKERMREKNESLLDTSVRSFEQPGVCGRRWVVEEGEKGWVGLTHLDLHPDSTDFEKGGSTN